MGQGLWCCQCIYLNTFHNCECIGVSLNLILCSCWLCAPEAVLSLRGPQCNKCGFNQGCGLTLMCVGKVICIPEWLRLFSIYQTVQKKSQTNLRCKYREFTNRQSLHWTIFSRRILIDLIHLHLPYPKSKTQRTTTITFLQIQIKLAMSRPLQQQLITGHLPLPRCYNGYTFDSKVGRSRKSMPFYLEEGLPPITMHYIRQEFQSISKIQCPRLTYFKSKIQSKTHPKPKSLSQSKMSYPERQAIKVQRQISNLKEELKYTLMTSDWSSNLVNKLINKAQDLQEEKEMRQTLCRFKVNKHKRSRSRRKEEEQFFPSTLGLVLEAKKQMMKNEPEQQQQPDNPQFDQKCNSIVLLPYSTIQQ